MMLTIRFDRIAGVAWHPGFDGWGGDFRATGGDAYFDVVRQMVDAGEPDTNAVFVDERGIACLTVRSILSCARRYRPNAADKIAKDERKRAAVMELAGDAQDGPR